MEVVEVYCSACAGGYRRSENTVKIPEICFGLNEYPVKAYFCRL